MDRRLRGLGYETSGVIALQRDIDTPEGVGPQSSYARSSHQKLAGRVYSGEHPSDARNIYQPRFIRHPNGSFELFETVLVSDDLLAFEKRYRDYLGIAPERDGVALRFQLPGGTVLTIVDVRGAGAMLPGGLLPPIPGIAAVGFRTRELAALREQLKSNGFTVIEIGERILIPAEEASGVAVLFGP